MTVGIRKLRENLSHYLDLAKSGEELVVTERGRPVVRIAAYRADKLAQLVAEGRVRPPVNTRRRFSRKDAASPAEVGVTADELLEQLLRDRGR